jgi:hypothetical protein
MGTVDIPPKALTKPARRRELISGIKRLMEAGKFGEAKHQVQVYRIETGESMEDWRKKITKLEKKSRPHGETGRKRK